jgi:hypothetical protein
MDKSNITLLKRMQDFFKSGKVKKQIIEGTKIYPHSGNYKIVVSEPWDFKNTDGTNSIYGKIIEVNPDNFIIFKSNESVKFDDGTGDLFILSPRYEGQNVLDHIILHETINGCLIQIKDYYSMNKVEIQKNSKFVLIGPIEKIEESNNWSTTVNELLEIYRGSLIAVIPWLEKARISWKDGESYDDWDNVSMTLYNNIVCSSLCSEVAQEYPIAKYDYWYKDYSEKSFIIVNGNDINDKICAFVSFQSITTPLDNIKLAVLDKSYNNKEFLMIKNCDLEYIFSKYHNGVRENLKEITVML